MRALSIVTTRFTTKTWYNGVCIPRLAECVLVLLLILCVISNNTANPKSRKKHRFTSVKGILPFLDKKERPVFHTRVMDWNFTNELSAARYMLNLYKSLGLDDPNRDAYGADPPNYQDNSRTSFNFNFNVSNVTTTKRVQGADTIMGILNDGKFCLSTNMFI